MLLLRIANFFRGYILISVEGFFLERFLNICTNRNIYLWNIRRRGDRKMTACISIRGFKKLATVAYKSNCRVKLLKRYGCPFIIFRHRKRHAFLVGIALFAMILLVMSAFIWGIEITGNDRISRAELQQALSDSGLKVGVLTSTLDRDAIRTKMMMEVPDIGWIGINVSGTKAVVEIKERVQKPLIIDKSKPYSIKAKYDGIVEKLDVKAGQRIVNEGDVVRAGQLLVSGVMDSKVQGVRYSYSAADVMMKTWREDTAEIVPYIEFEQRTGNEKSKHIIKLFGYNINLFWDDKVYFERFERVSEVKQPAVGKNFLLPFSFHYDKFYETEIIRQEVTPEEAYNNCVEMLRNRISEQLEPDTVILKEDFAEKTDEQGRRMLTLTCECRDTAVLLEEIITQ